MGMRTSRRTYLSLIAGCARASRSAAAYDLYRSREPRCTACGASLRRAAPTCLWPPRSNCP